MPHALRCALIGISIHALLAESDVFARELLLRYQEFLSTLSLRRATCAILVVATQQHNFYPRSPCGERPGLATIQAP